MNSILLKEQNSLVCSNKIKPEGKSDEESENEEDLPSDATNSEDEALWSDMVCVPPIKKPRMRT